MLSAEEKERAAHFIKKEDSHDFILSHGILRNILSRYVEIAPEKINFIKTAYGKPSLEDSLLRFNMSHTQEIALYGVTWHREIGIDVEFISRSVEVEGLAKRFFSSDDYHRLMRLPLSARKEAFFCAWVRKEAYLKAQGQGLSGGLDQCDVSLHLGESEGLLKLEGSEESARLWTVPAFAYEKKYRMAFAVQGKVKSVKYFRWELSE